MAKEQEIALVENGAVFIFQAGTPIYVKTADICAITGKSNQWIGQLTSQGTLNKVKTPHGSMYELSQSLKAYCAMLEERAESQDGNPEDEKIERERRKADAGIKAAKAIITGLEAKERQLKMHRSEDVAAMTEDLIFAVRGALLAMPGRLSVEVASISDPAEISAVIQREVYKLMEDLSTYRYDSKKYEERVRGRLNMGATDEPDDEEE